MTLFNAEARNGRERGSVPTPPEGEGLLLDLPVPFRRINGDLWVEAQVLNGLRLWSENFARLTVTAPVLPDAQSDEPGFDWANPEQLLAKGGVQLVALPWGYKHFDHYKLAGQVRQTLGSLVDSHRYLCLSNVGGFGAWSNLAVDWAIARRRPYSLWFDNVAHEMPRDPPRSVLHAAKQWLDLQYSKRKTFHAIRHASLGLFHGLTVYEAYAGMCPQSALVHDIHCGPGDAITDDQLRQKVAAQVSAPRVRIGYAGRVHPIKGPFDWIDVLQGLAERVGSDAFEATWYGHGPAFEEARERTQAAGLDGCVRFAGHVRDRETLLGSLRELDIFLFCHLTPESPRCLIESLISGTPLLGYESAYARDLVGDRGGGAFVPIGDRRGLTDRLERLVRDRSALGRLATEAATARAIFSDEAVFRHRSDLIKQHLKSG
jgi:glycosyltransferase involved in cell wall biosynthesis